MADQRRIQPLGILRNQEIIISSLLFSTNFVVLKMDEGDSPYPLLLGRPWLKIAKVKQDWSTKHHNQKREEKGENANDAD